MSKSVKILLIIIGIFVILAGVLGIVLMGQYNSFVSADEKVTASWAQVENQYKRRSDLIPNLVNTVKGYAKHEKETLDSVVKARSEATKNNINIKDAQELSTFQNQQNNISSALSKLMLVVERYPTLKANQNFINLQVNLEGTENRIATARRDYNLAVKDYNVLIRRFPGNLVAGLFGFQRANMFQITETEKKNPQVNF